MANEDRNESLGDESPLFWLSTNGGDVRYHLNRVHAISQIVMCADLRLVDHDTIPNLIGIVMDDVNAAISTLERGGAK